MNQAAAPNSAQAAGETSEFLSDFGVGDAVGWLLVIAGWYVVRKDEARRAMRGEDREALREISEQVCAIRDRAITYYTTATVGQPETLEHESFVKHELQSVGRNVGALRERKPHHYDVAAEIIRLRQAVTGGEFESNARVLISHKDPRVQEIRFAAGDLIGTMKQAFEKANRL